MNCEKWVLPTPVAHAHVCATFVWARNSKNKPEGNYRVGAIQSLD